jgi:hypothetical protein
MNAREVAYTKAGIDIHRQNVIKAVRLPKLYNNENFLIIVDTKPAEMGESPVQAFIMSSKDECETFLKSEDVVKYIMFGTTSGQNIVRELNNDAWDVIAKRTKAVIRGFKRIQRKYYNFQQMYLSSIKTENDECNRERVYEIIVKFAGQNRYNTKTATYRINTHGDVRRGDA